MAHRQYADELALSIMVDTACYNQGLLHREVDRRNFVGKRDDVGFTLLLKGLGGFEATNAGEFGGLFGDGASAFLLSARPADAKSLAYRLGDFFFGCATKYAEAIAVSDAGGGKLEVQFDGDALSRAAISRMEKVIDEVEHRSGISRDTVGAFATHQPNPRLVTLLAKQLGVSVKYFPPIVATRGNLGSSMCGAALHDALHHAAAQPADQRKPVFLASLGPGLLFGGGWMVPAGT